MLDFLKSLLTWWNGATLNTRFYTWRKGVKIGEDRQGNSFYENRAGSRRWVIYNGEAEASRISPQWHGWLHHTYKAPPVDKPLPRKDWEKEHIPNLTGTAQAYAPKGSLRSQTPSSARSDYDAWQPE